LTLSPSGGDSVNVQNQGKNIDEADEWELNSQLPLDTTSARVAQTHMLFDTVHSVEARNSFPQLTDVTACLIWVSEKQRSSS
jgi:hypothetical protein